MFENKQENMRKGSNSPAQILGKKKKEEYKNKYPAIACIYTRCLWKKKQATLFLLRPCVLSLPSPDTLHCVVSKQPYCEQL